MQTSDFEVEYDKDGNFKYKMFNNQAREFDSTYKSEVYDKDGNFISSLTVRDNEVISEKMINGQKQVTKMSFEDAFMGLALEGDFSTAGEILGDADILAGGHDIYALADKYKQTTGHELVLDVFDAGEKVEDANLKAGITNLLSKLQPHGSVGGVGQDRKTAILENYKKGYEQFKEIRNFDPYKSQIADLLPKIQRIQHSENSFSGKINNDNYNVKINGGKLYISKNNGEELSLDVSGFPSNYVKNTFSKVSASVLYDIAKTGTSLKLNDQVAADDSGTNGFYRRGQIQLDPNSTIGERAVKLLAHECGHMCDDIDDKENAVKAIKKYLEDPFATIGVDKPRTVNELLESQGTIHPVSIGDETLKETFAKEYENYKKNPPNVNSNSKYALTSLNEFFAESYSLLNIGDCKSAYVIAKYFPESFARIKELMEQNRALREK